MLISFSGLPGVGKSTVSRLLAQRIRAMHLRIDVIEQAMRDTGQSLTADEGYRVAYALAEDNLRLGRTVISDCVNDVTITRDAWRAVAERVGVPFLDVEAICSNEAEHRRRVETRVSEIRGLVLPTWDEVRARQVDRWDRKRLVVDTARYGPDQIVEQIETAIAALGR